MSLSSASSSLGPPPAYSANGVTANTELKIYLDDAEGKTNFRWQIRDSKKRLLHLIQYTSDQACLKAGSQFPLRAQFQEELGSITLPVKLLLADERSFVLQAQQFSLWTLTVSHKSGQEKYSLIRRTTGWDIHFDTPEGESIASMRKNHGESKLGRLTFSTSLTEPITLALLFSLSFAISTANARFQRELGFPASTEYDRIEKYGDLNDLRPTLKSSGPKSKLPFTSLLRPSPSHSILASTANIDY